jgi:archaellum component FlaC
VHDGELAGSGRVEDDGAMPEQAADAREADTREVRNALSRIEALIRGLDDRVGRLEDRVGGVDDKARRVEVELAELKGRVSQLPTAWMLFTGGSGLILAIFGASFALLRFGLPR